MSQPEMFLAMPHDLTRDLLAAVADDDVARADPILADNLLLLLPDQRPVHGKAAALRLLCRARRHFVEIGFTCIASHSSEAGWLVSTWSVRGTRPSGEPLRQEIGTVVRLDREGRIAYLSEDFRASRGDGTRAASTTTAVQVDAPTELRSF